MVFVEPLHRYLFNWPHGTASASVVEHAVQSPEILHGVIDHGLDVAFPGHIRVKVGGLCPQLPRQAFASIALDVCHHYPGPLLDKESHRSLADAAGSTCDHCHFAIKLSQFCSLLQSYAVASIKGFYFPAFHQCRFIDAVAFL